MEELIEELCLAKGMFSNGLQERVVDYELFCENNNLINTEPSSAVKFLTYFREDDE